MITPEQALSIVRNWIAEGIVPELSWFSLTERLSLLASGFESERLKAADAAREQAIRECAAVVNALTDNKHARNYSHWYTDGILDAHKAVLNLLDRQTVTEGKR